MKKNKLLLGILTAALTLTFTLVLMGCPTSTSNSVNSPDDGNGNGNGNGNPATLTAGPAVNVQSYNTTASVTFTGASGLSLTAADFEVSPGATVTEVRVSSNTATVTVTFAANLGTTSRTYTVSIASTSTIITNRTTVTITQARSASDNRAELTAGAAVNAAAADTSAAVTFTIFSSYSASLTAADFEVSSDSTISNVDVVSTIITVTVSFAVNASTSPKTYTVSIASTSGVIKGNATVVITQEAVDNGNITVIPPAIPDDAIDLTGAADPVAWLNGTITAAADTGSYSGETWTLQENGRRKSPTIGNYQTTKNRYNFISTSANTSLVIHLNVSLSYSNYNIAFVGYLDDSTANSSYYFAATSNSETITIPVPTAGSHFVQIGFYATNSNGPPYAWFTIEPPETSPVVFSWYIDGIQIDGQTSSVLAAQDASDYTLGTHSLTVTAVKSDGKLYSKTVNFTIVKE
jgi:hypothetical protein